MKQIIYLDRGESEQFGNHVYDHVTVGLDVHSRVWVMYLYDHRLDLKLEKSFEGSDCGRQAITWLGTELDCAGRDIHVCYEAGRSGFWPARELQKYGISAHVIPIGRLEIVKGGKRAKTNRLDARFLAALDPVVNKRVPQVHIPTMEEERLRSLMRQRQHLMKQRMRCNQHILSIIARFAICNELQQEKYRSAAKWRALLDDWRDQGWVGTLLPLLEADRIEDAITELEHVEERLYDWEGRLAQEFPDECCTPLSEQYKRLMRLRGLGLISILMLCGYIGSFKRFRNGKAFASYFGLAPVPHDSADKHQDKGISKAGNGELRRLAVQLAWLWLCHQPDSWISKKYAPKLARGGRLRRIAIIAMARQLMVALYRYVVHDEPIEGAVMKDGRPMEEVCENRFQPSAATP